MRRVPEHRRALTLRRGVVTLLVARRLRGLLALNGEPRVVAPRAPERLTQRRDAFEALTRRGLRRRRDDVPHGLRRVFAALEAPEGSHPRRRAVGHREHAPKRGADAEHVLRGVDRARRRGLGCDALGVELSRSLIGPRGEADVGDAHLGGAALGLHEHAPGVDAAVRERRLVTRVNDLAERVGDLRERVEREALVRARRSRQRDPFEPRVGDVGTRARHPDAHDGEQRRVPDRPEALHRVLKGRGHGRRAVGERCEHLEHREARLEVGVARLPHLAGAAVLEALDELVPPIDLHLRGKPGVAHRPSQLPRSDAPDAASTAISA